LLLQEGSAFAAWFDFSDWLWQRTASTHQFTPEALLDALFDYLTLERALPADSVRSALLADYLASGARSNPKSLQGLLPRREKSPQQQTITTQHKPAAQRQSRHQASPAAAPVPPTMPALALPAKATLPSTL
jgi:hypothetical protein